MNFNPKDISNQIIFLLNHHPHPCHIKDKESRYLYMNQAMYEFLNLPTGFLIEGKGYLTSNQTRRDFLRVSISKRRSSYKNKTPSLYS